MKGQKNAGEGYRRLTRRQAQFLEVLVHIYNEKGVPISYKEVAENLGVSKWTAYDIIQEIYRKGFLDIEYKLGSGPGRSEVRYVPKDFSLGDIIEGDRNSGLVSIKGFMNEQLSKIEEGGISKAINFVAGKVKQEKNPLLIVLYTVSLFIVFAKVFRIDTESMINLRNILSSGISPDVILMFLLELMVSIVEKEENLLKYRVEKPVLDNFKIIERQFKENLGLVSPRTQKRVITYLQAIV